MTDCTALAWPGLVNTSTDMNCSPPNASLSMKRGNSPTGSSIHSAATPLTWPWPTTCTPRRTGELQLSSNGTMTCKITLPPWSQSTRAWPLPLRPSNDSWIKASDAFSAHMPTSSTSSSASSMRVLTLTPSQREKGSLPSSLTVHTMVWLDSSWRVMSQSGLPGGMRTTEGMGEMHLTPRAGRAV